MKATLMFCQRLRDYPLKLYPRQGKRPKDRRTCLAKLGWRFSPFWLVSCVDTFLQLTALSAQCAAAAQSDHTHRIRSLFCLTTLTPFSSHLWNLRRRDVTGLLAEPCHFLEVAENL